MEHADCFENVRLVLSEGGEYPVPGENYIFYTLTINLIIIAIASFFFGLEPAMYTLVSIYVSSTVLDKVQQGFGSSKSVMIITGNKKRVIYCIVALKQLAKLKQIVNEIDSNAFMAVSDTAEVLGHGFGNRGI